VVFSSSSTTSLNSYGYSPHPLASYIQWVQELLTDSTTTVKPIIISITDSDPNVLKSMLVQIRELRYRLKQSSNSDEKLDLSHLVAVELNTSCPNIKNKPPPAYKVSLLKPLLDVLAEEFWIDESLPIGLKLPPYNYSTQFTDIVECLSQYSKSVKGISKNPFAFLTCTNTLGSSLLFPDQVVTPFSPQSPFALPTGLGGLGGDAIHSLALGNVYTFTQLLSSHGDPAMKNIKLIGVGGVTSSQARKRMHDAGASVVGCATLLGLKGVAGFELLNH
ncbi:hypothetical protein QCA50_020099, partial [Cerrena zonata]